MIERREKSEEQASKKQKVSGNGDVDEIDPFSSGSALC